MPLGYTAGPYRAKTEWELIYNIRQAEYWAVYGWSFGCAMICPHKNTSHFGGVMGIDDIVWLEGDLVMMERCDFIFVIPGWERSSGTMGEIDRAEELGIPVFYMPQEENKFIEWLEEWNRRVNGVS